jgi:type III secretion system FlhB-like substrate exporter
MNNIIIEKVSKPKYFGYKPLPLYGASMPIPGSLPGFLFPAEVYYKFIQAEYKTLPDYIQEIKKSDIVIVGKNEFIVGLKNIEKKMKAPIVVFKEKYTKNIIRLCKENHTFVKHQIPLARCLYDDVDVGDEIPPELYQIVAKILAVSKKKSLGGNLCPKTH